MSSKFKVCEILEKHKNTGVLKSTSDYFSLSLLNILNNYDDIFDKILGFGLMKGLRLKNENILESVIKTLFEEGVIVLKSGKNVLRFLPPLTITNKEIKEGFRRIEIALKRIKDGN